MYLVLTLIGLPVERGSCRRKGFSALFIAALLLITILGCEQTEGPQPSQGPNDESQEPTWPQWPSSTQQAKQLVDGATKRSLDGDDERLDFVKNASNVFAGLTPEKLSIGWPALTSRLSRALSRDDGRERAAYLLVGSFHDSPGQIDAFRHLIEPGGVEKLTAVAVEQFRSSGSWVGAPHTPMGDDRLLRRFSDTGSHEAWHSLRREQERLSYTAWRYGAVPELLSLLSATRARGIPMLGCDMPPTLRNALSDLDTALVDRLRELHCRLSIADVFGDDAHPRVAIFWGEDHLSNDGFIRFLEEDAHVVRVSLVGARWSRQAPERRVAENTIIEGPTLIQLDEQESRFILILDDENFGADVERSRHIEAERTQEETELRVVSTRAGIFSIAGEERAIRANQALSLTLDAAQRPFIFRSGSARWVGLLELQWAANASLELDLSARRSRVIYGTSLPAMEISSGDQAPTQRPVAGSQSVP